MSLAECTALLFQAVNENSVSLLEAAKRTYSENQLLASLVQCNEVGETPLVIAMRGRNDRVIDEFVKVLRICDRTIEENQLKLSIAIRQLSQQIPTIELIGYLASKLQDSSEWLKFIAQVFKESTSLMQKDKIITALELIGAILMNFNLLSVSPMLFGLECWKVAMTLRYCPEDGQPPLPKIPIVSVSSEASSLVYGSAIEVVSLEELDILQENFIEDSVQPQCRERIKIQALLVIRRITTQANLEYPHWLYIESLGYFTEFYHREIFFEIGNYKLVINVHLLLMEQLNGFDPKLLPRKTFDVFTKSIRLLSLIFFELLENYHPERKELNYKNLLAPTECISSLSKFFANPAMISSVIFKNTSFAAIVFRFLAVLDEIFPQMSNQEKQKLEEYYSNFIQNFFAHRTSTVLHIIFDPPSNLKLDKSHWRLKIHRVIQWLLKLGANPNAVDGNGNTPLHILAAKVDFFLMDERWGPSPGRGVLNFRALVDADTHLDTANDDGETVISILKENGEIAHPYLESLVNTVFPLRCYCARVIRRNGIPINRLPSRLQSFVAMHSNVEENGWLFQNRMAAANMTIEDIVNGINSGDENKEITATHAARKILSVECHPLIDILINASVVPKLVEFLSRVSNPDLQFESAWALSNIASGTSDQTKAVVSAGAVAGFISLLGSPHPDVAEKAVWALGNIAGDGPELRDHVIEQGIIKPLLTLIKPDTSATFLRNVTWTLSNLCRNKNPPPSVPAVRQLLPALAQLIHNNDKEIIADACWALYYLTEGLLNERIQEVVDAGVVPRLVALLDHTEVSVINPTLRTIRNIVTGSEVQKDSVLAAGACPLLAKLLEHSEMNITIVAAWTVSNIAVGNTVQIQALFTNNVIRPWLEVVAKGNFQCQNGAAWAIVNITLGGNVEQIALLCQFGAIAPLCNLLEAKEPETILFVLYGLANILAAAEKMGELEKVSLHVEECGGLDRVEALQNHDNVVIYHKSLAILEQYFSTEDDEDSELAPSTSQSGNDEFNNQPTQAPEGGFSF